MHRVPPFIQIIRMRTLEIAPKLGCQNESYYQKIKSTEVEIGMHGG